MFRNSPMNRKLIIEYIIQQLKEIRAGKPWMGNSFADKLNDLDETLVFQRPLENLHSVA